MKLVAAMTPIGLCEWVVMPMGCRNVPATHQGRMIQVLDENIETIRHVYRDLPDSA